MRTSRAAGLAGLLALACARAPAPAPGAPVLLVCIDTLRADRLPAYGNRRIATPALDALAGDSAVFERALAHVPQTLPSHATLFTGELPPATKVHDNLGFRLEPGRSTLASRLRDQGYRTAGFVSAYVLRAATGIGQGFETWDDRTERQGPQSGLGGVQRPGPETVARAVDWLEKLPPGKSWFVFVHLFEPHTPYAPPEPHRSRAPTPYEGEIVAADAALAPLLDALRRRGEYGRAAIALLSDHGEGLGDHGEDEHGLFLYEEAVRVPLFLKPPGRGLGGRRVLGVAALSDVAPTLLELVGAPPLAAAAGMSLRSAMGSGRIAPRVIYGESFYGRFHFGWAELLSASDERHRFIRAPRPELYDLERDPGERSNLAATRPDERGRLERYLDALASAAPAAPAAASAEEQEKLQALGYLGAAPVATAGAAAPDPKDRAPAIQAFRRALQARQAGQDEEAVRELSGLLELEPRMADAWEVLARLESDRRNHERALAAARRLEELRPGEPEPQLLLARLLLKLRRFDEAYARAAPAVAREPALANELLCRIRLEQGRIVEAVAHGELALAADPELALPHFARGWRARGEGRLEDALGDLERAREALARHPNVELRTLHLARGDVLARLGREVEAEAALREELRVDPRSVEARVQLAALLEALGRGAEALALIGEIEGFAASAAPLARAVQALAVFGEREAAAALLGRSLARFPGDPVLLELKRGLR